VSADGHILTHPTVIAWRNRLRHNKLLVGAYKLWVGRSSYEERFGQGLLDAIAPGDVVWDIGANVGLYTEQFLRRHADQVTCFEPAPEAVRILQRKFGPDSPHPGRVSIVPAALSNARGTARFAADGSSPTNKIAAADDVGKTIEVPVLRADDALREYGLRPPNVVKIDVEGYELEVIGGLANTLRSRALRAVFIEVHFSLLHERGLDYAPSEIIRTLKELDFEITWLDPSHLRASRKAR
jgi:FkbM family methyltransferase